MQNCGAQIWTEFIFPKRICEERICEKRCFARRFSTAPSWRMPFLYPPKPLELIFRQIQKRHAPTGRGRESPSEATLLANSLLADPLRKDKLRPNLRATILH